MLVFEIIFIMTKVSDFDADLGATLIKFFLIMTYMDNLDITFSSIYINLIWI